MVDIDRDQNTNRHPLPSTVLFIVGPTASGKSALAMRLAERVAGELICADSRTVYRGLDICTAKPSLEDRQRIRHYGLDIVEPDRAYSAAQFQAAATGWIEEISAKGKLPIVVGGTGLYIDGLLYNYSFGPPADPQQREAYETMTVDQLQSELRMRKLKIPENTKNKRYLIRALEQEGINTNRSSIDENALVIGLMPPRYELFERIRSRAKSMLAAGAEKEVERLETTYGNDTPAGKMPFVKAFGGRTARSITEATALEAFITNDCRLAKKQITWFKRNEHIVWFASADEAFEYVIERFAGSLLKK